MSKNKKGHHTVTHDIQRTVDDFAEKVRQSEWMHEWRIGVAWAIVVVGAVLLLIALSR